ncbi:uncharacterized protein CG4449 [Odontomachus brunneus]|uniref:uncharacterized protein CG4449 n=1 Tax=Odontomachus brunneus TaxID=486640 RepID=UPI0013F1865E|nr:uncharacterized protein CG4449 [Odontomachus brunneus]XP_032686454.1 uncharacterized protein CG4449 [Odontomachus brunneus]XP_032686531.1 uncharacterized protein CG4449 [Odontomachus brunneus]XP_032686598.1 uncharacterized protein CG4449 [Odontomachus brunneus]
MDKVIEVESSSDDDDTYTNPAARLRALKQKRLENEKLEKSISVAVINDENDVTITNTEVLPSNIINENNIQTETRITRSGSRGVSNGRGRSRGKGRGRGRSRCTFYPTTRSTRKRHSFVDTLEVEFIPLEHSDKPISEPTKDDIIALSSDDDACGEDDNYEINIKVLWRSVRLDRLSMRRHDSFLKIFQHYADLEKVSVDEILIMRNDKIINLVDTPALLNLSVIDILDGGIVNPGMNTLSCKDKDNDENDECNIKVQTANKKQSLIVPLKKNQQFRTLFSYCALQLGEDESNLKFHFDGEQIDPTDTPESLDMEGEACIDLRISSV